MAWYGKLPELDRKSAVDEIALECALGAASALGAIGIRLILPLSPNQLPTFTVLIAVLLTSVFVSARAGAIATLVGGLSAWYFLFEPFSWKLDASAAVTLAGFSFVATSIVTATYVYRRSETKLHQMEVRRLESEMAASELFAHEMAHRLKNALALVQSLASQTMGHDDVRVASFTARLQALANAHTLLGSDVTQPKAIVSDVISSSVAPFRVDKDRFVLTGPAVEIASQQVVSLALALHELSTNAVKYGALSGEGGSVRISWIDEGPSISVRWEEAGGPKVTPPTNAGFGSRLLQRALQNARLQYLTEGVVAEFELRKPKSG